MRIPGTRRFRLTVLLSLAALAAVIGLLLFNRARALYRNLGPLVVQEIKRQLGREVAIGHIDVHVPGKVVLDDVAIAEGKRLASGVMVRAKRVILYYSWRSLLMFRPDLVGSIDRVEIQDPHLLLVRFASGRFNVQDLIKPRRPGAPPVTFRAPVVVTRGSVHLLDYKAALPQLPAINDLTSVDGTVDFRTYPRMTVTAAGLGTRGRADRLQVDTLIDLISGRSLIQAYVSNAAAAYWSSYFARTPAARVQTGRANLNLVAARTAKKAPVQFVVNLAARGLGVSVARLRAPLQDGRGFAQITTYGLKVDASARLAGMPVQVSGNLLDWKHPQVALSVNARGITLAAVRQLLPQAPRLPPGLEVTAPGTAQAWVLGPAPRLYASGTLVVPGVVWRGERVRLAEATWRYHAGMLELDRVSAAARGGQLTATGWAQLVPGPARLYLTGQVSRVNLAHLPGVPPRTRTAGTADAQFAVSGTPKDLHAGATIHLSDPEFNTVRLTAAAARLDYQDGVLYVRSLQASDPRGRLAAAGRVAQHGRLDLQVRARGIDVAALLAPFTRERTSGTAFFRGSLGGTIRAPQLDGRLQLYAGQVGSVGVDYAAGPVTVLPDRVETTGMVLRLYPGQITVSGAAGGWREGRALLDLHAVGSELNIARLLAIANLKTRASGTLSGDLSLKGVLPTPVASGTLQVDDLLLEGVNLGTATARLETNGRQLLVRQASVQGEALAATAQGAIGLVPALTSTPALTPTPARARGPAPAPAPGTASTPRLAGRRTITKDSPLDLTFAVQRLDLARAAARAEAGVVLVGTAQVTDGKVTGRLGAPVVTARADVAPLAVNGVTLGGLSGQVAYTREQVTLRDMALQEDHGTVRVSQASLRPQAGKPLNGLTVDATVDAFPVQRLVEVALNSATVRRGPVQVTPTTAGLAQVSGVVSGTITARPETSAAGAPALWTAALSVPALTLPGYRLPAETGPDLPANSQPLSVGLEARASYSMAGRVVIDRVAITRGEGILLAQGALVREGGQDAQGKVLPEGQIALRVDATDIPLGLLSPLAPALHPLRGVSELHLDAGGTLHSPTVQASVEVDKPALAGIPFSRFSVPFLRVGAPAGGALGRIEIANARLEMDDKDHPSGQHYLLLDGTLPFRWRTNDRGAVTGGGIPADAPVSLTVRLPDQSLDLFNTLSKVDPRTVNARLAPVLTALGGLSAVSGTVSANLHIAGTRLQPDTSGAFQIADGALQPQHGETKFDQIAVRLAFTGNRIQIQQLTGRSSNGGDFVGSGQISGIAFGVGDQVPAARLNLALALNDLHYTERNLSAYLQERFRGTLRTVARGHPDQSAPLRLTGDWRSPTLDGEIDVLDSRLALPASLPQAQVRALVPVPNPKFLLDVRLDRDVWLENPLVRLQMTGTLPVRGTLAQPSVRGTLTVQRGQMTFPTARFRVEGTVDIAYSPEPSTPAAPVAPATLRVDLTANARVRGTDPNTGQRQSYDVTLTIRGPLTAENYQAGATLISEAQPGQQLTIQATSDPPLSQDQILALLGMQSALQAVARGGASAQDALRNTVTDAFTGAVLPTLFNPVETSIERSLGLEDFSIDFALDQPTQILMTKKLYGHFHVTYTQAITTGGYHGPSVAPSSGITPATSLNLYTVELFYKFSNRYRLGYRFAEPSGNDAVLLNTTFRF
jgi:hypothetical protein